jgi:predicted Zn-dependent peptidase
MKKFLAIVIMTLSCLILFANDNFAVKTLTDSNGNQYKVVENDPFGVREYTLENGLKVFLSENNEKPEISTMIAVKAGSTYDPSDNTGLAHYLEHLMFKGTDEIGTKNWEEEKKILAKISSKFEEHKRENDPEKKKVIYSEIDSLSQIASQYSIPSELSKIFKSIGAKGTNAFTSTERTVYMNTIPANQLDRWIAVENERFSQLVLRLFHTELETVYEEFNTGQSNDRRQIIYTLNELLFPNHPYGTQTTIGKAEHLKNPSMVNIHEYWNKYYVANNIALILVGDLNPDETFAKIKNSFSNMRVNPNLEHPKFDNIKKLDKIKEREVFGPSAESVALGFVIESKTDDESIKAELISSILFNGSAGLIDLNLNQTRKVASAYCNAMFYNNAGEFIFMGNPTQDQTLEEVKDLLLAELDKIKHGDFDENILNAIINNREVGDLRKIEYNYYHWFVLDAFASEIEWAESLNRIEKMKTITKQDLVDYANKNLNNYAVVYKRKGENKNVVTVDKPQITPIQIDRANQSDFYHKIQQIKENRLEPDFKNYAELVKTKKYKGITFNYIQNMNNELAQFFFIFNMGDKHDKLLPIALDYFKFAGTENRSAQEFSKQYYNLGLYDYAGSFSDESFLQVNGLDGNLDEGIELLLDRVNNLKGDEQTFKMFIGSILKERMNEKTSDSKIISRVRYKATYGDDNYSRYHLTNAELEELTVDDVVAKIKSLMNYDHMLFYYGPRDFKKAYKDVKKIYKPAKKLQDTPEEKEFVETGETGKVYFAEYDKVQASVYMIAQDDIYNEKLIPYYKLMNEFYGAGLSSVVFQEIRESKGLVYSAYSYYTVPDKKENHHYLNAALETQPDKVEVAVDEMLNILTVMPESKKQFETSKQSVLKKIESKRVTKANIFWDYLSNMKFGRSDDYEEKIYNAIKEMSYEDFENFFKQHVAGKKYNYVVVGKKSDIDFEMLKKYGEIEEVDVDKIFNY